MSQVGDVGKKLVAFCREGKNDEAMKQLYDKDIVSVEAMAPPGQQAESKGLDACLQKSKHWVETHEVHSAKCEGPYPNGDKFAVHFIYDVTEKPSGKRMALDEVALYTVKNGKIVREEFYYDM